MSPLQPPLCTVPAGVFTKDAIPGPLWWLLSALLLVLPVTVRGRDDKEAPEGSAQRKWIQSAAWPKLHEGLVGGLGSRHEDLTLPH